MRRERPGFCIDERHRPRSLSLFESSPSCQGSGLAASLAPRSWLEQALQHPDRASSSQGCLMSLSALLSSTGYANQPAMTGLQHTRSLERAGIWAVASGGAVHLSRHATLSERHETLAWEKKKRAPTTLPHHLRGLDMAWPCEVNPHREGTPVRARQTVGRQRIEGQNARPAEEDGGDRLWRLQ